MARIEKKMIKDGLVPLPVSKPEIKEVKEVKELGCKVIAIADYVERIAPDVGNGTPRRKEAIKTMMDENGIDKFVVQISMKGEDYYVFKR